MTVAGQSSALSQRYSFVDLIQPPVVTAISPLSGPLTGGTMVTVTGTGYNSIASVTFEELRGNGSATGARLECAWSPTALPGTLCNLTTVMCVPVLPASAIFPDCHFCGNTRVCCVVAVVVVVVVVLFGLS